MGPIPPVNVGSAGSAGGARPVLNQAGSTSRAGTALGGAQLTASPTPGDAMALTRIHAAVSQLLQSIGGGAENDKILRMLIALIILLALLKDPQGEAASTNNALTLPAGRGGQYQFVGFYSSSTTITIEQTTTTMVFQAMDTYASASGGDQVQPRGDQLDVAG